MPKENDKGWLDHLWREQSGVAFTIFNLWGHLQNEIDKKPGLEHLINMVEKNPYGPEEIFKKSLFEVEYAKFLDGFGGAQLLRENTDVYVNLLNPYFVKYVRNIPSDEIVNEKDEFVHNFSLGFWLYGLFLIYSHLLPDRLSVEKCLVLNHNAQHIYGEAIMYFYGADILAKRHGQTREANLPRLKNSKLIIDKIESYRKMHVENSPRFDTLSKLQQATRIYKDIKEEDENLKIAIRTIRRKLAERT